MRGKVSSTAIGTVKTNAGAIALGVADCTEYDISLPMFIDLRGELKEYKYKPKCKVLLLPSWVDI